VSRIQPAALAAVLLAIPTPALAADAPQWPTRAVRLIVPFAPGGSSDIAGRVFSQRLSERLGHQVVVDNRSSAGGVVGAELLARAAPDGQTLGLANVSSQTISPLIFPNVSYHPVTSFTFAAFIGTVPVVLLAHPGYAARSVADLVRMAKAAPGKIDYGSGGNGAISHIVGELFKLETGTNLTHVPYRGAAFMMIDLRANAIPIGFDVLAQASENIRGGYVRALAVSSSKRVALAPDVPTFVELGFPNLVGENWLGFAGPAGLPRPMVDRLHGEVSQLAKTPEIAERLAALGITHQAMTPAEFHDYVAKLHARWTPVMKAARISAN
jgi:tripartite-type tricarboxylate transporter receptor subunit TctC